MVRNFWDYSKTYVVSPVFTKFQTHKRFRKKKSFRIKNKPARKIEKVMAPYCVPSNSSYKEFKKTIHDEEKLKRVKKTAQDAWKLSEQFRRTVGDL